MGGAQSCTLTLPLGNGLRGSLGGCSSGALVSSDGWSTCGNRDPKSPEFRKKGRRFAPARSFYAAFCSHVFVSSLKTSSRRGSYPLLISMVIAVPSCRMNRRYVFPSSSNSSFRTNGSCPGDASIHSVSHASACFSWSSMYRYLRGGQS